MKLASWLTLFDTFDSAKDPKFDPADLPAASETTVHDVDVMPTKWESGKMRCTPSAS